MIRQENGVFCIETKQTGYYIAPRGPLMEQLHYGRKLRCPSAEVLRQPLAVAYGTDVIYDKDFDPALSLLHLGLELSPTEKGDFRQSALALTLGNGSPVCDLRYAGAQILPHPPESSGLPMVREGGECLMLRFESKEGVAAELLYIPLDSCDVIVRQTRLVNNSGSPITLHRAMSYQLDLPRQDFLLTTLTGAWAREFEPDTASVRQGRTVLGSVSGTSSHYCNPFFALSDPNTDEHAGDIYGFNLLYSGSHAASIETDSYGSLRIMAGIQPEGFHWTLSPGESFLTPQAALTFSTEGRNGLRCNMHRLVTDHILPPQWRNAPRPILVNNWEATYFDFTPRKLRALAAKAAGLGSELFVLDDGWFGRRTDDTRGLGDFDPNPKKLPDSLAGLAKDLKTKGLSFGLWVEPEMVSQDSALYEQHPDWAVASPGVSPSFGRNQLVLDLCREEVREYLIAQLNHLLDSAPIRYIKWDMNRHHTDRFSAALSEQGRFAHSWTLGLYQVLEAVTSSHPDVLFEGCASGGNRFDLGILYYMPQIWLSDDTDAWQRCKMQTWASLGYPPGVMGCHVSAAPNHQTLRFTPLDSRFDVAAFGLLGYELDLTALNAAQEKSIKEQIAFYKHHRGLFQHGRFYCLSTPEADQGGAWMVVSEDRQKAAVLEMTGLLRPNAPMPILRLAGLDEACSYRVSLRQQSVELDSFRTLLNHVLPVKLRADGMLVHLAGEVYQMPCEQMEFTAGGDLLMHAGLRLPQRFCGSGYTDGVRPMPDFSARIWLLEAQENPSLPLLPEIGSGNRL